ncbi:unnamed protein product [Ixodes pacificus]
MLRRFCRSVTVVLEPNVWEPRTRPIGLRGFVSLGVEGRRPSCSRADARWTVAFWGGSASWPERRKRPLKFLALRLEIPSYVLVRLVRGGAVRTGTFGTLCKKQIPSIGT